MITSKQRAWLRAKANSMPSQFQIGKGELTSSLTDSLDEMLTTHELLKLTVLKTAETEPAEIGRQLAEAVGADIVQLIGRRIVLYRHSEKLAEKGRSMLLP
ncbi:MAG: YhbY family RNA-binding protein [Eubacteriales bacterium]|nr:YhbY family RNA-binding protein [Eubacteriales bacterium]MDD3866487.1 YhbY family RNA-binding protein [Eubacteriales bacterium]MDD4461675.1 YhbY family RNA-binding protein [Eubacteriales bacterium]